MPSPPMEAQEPVAPAGLNPSGRLTPLAGEGDAQSVSAAEIELVQTDEVAVVAIQAAEVPAVVVPVEVADPQEQKQGQKVKLLMGATGFFAVLATGFLVATVVLAARLSSVDDAKTTAQVALAALSTTTTTTTVRSAGSLAGESQAALEALSGQANITVDSDFLLSIGGNDPQVVEAWTDAMSSEFPGGVVKFTAPIKVGSSGQTGGRRLQAGGSVSFSSSALVDKSTHYVNVRITFAAGAAAPSVSVELYPEIEGTMGDYHKAKFNVDSGAHSKAKAKLKGFKKPAAYKNLALHGHVLASKSGSEVLLGNPRTGFAAGRVMQVKAGQRMSISTATGKTMDHCKHSAMSRHKASCGNSPHFEANESAAQEGNGSNASRRLQSSNSSAESSAMEMAAEIGATGLKVVGKIAAGPIQIGPLTLYNVSVGHDSNGGAADQFNFSGSASIALAGGINITLGMWGDLPPEEPNGTQEDSVSMSLSGTIGDMPLGASGAVAESVHITLQGHRDDMSDGELGPWSYNVVLGGLLQLGSMPGGSAFKGSLDETTGSVALSMSNIQLMAGVQLQSFNATLSESGQEMSLECILAISQGSVGDITVQVSGSLSNGGWQLQGSLSSLVIPVGANTITFADISVSLSGSPPANSSESYNVTGLLSASATWAGLDWNARLSFDTAAPMDALSIKLVEKSGSGSLSLNDLVSASSATGGSAPTTTDPSNVTSNMGSSAAEIMIQLNPPMLLATAGWASASGTGQAAALLSVHSSKNTTGSFAWALAVEEVGPLSLGSMLKSSSSSHGACTLQAAYLVVVAGETVQAPLPKVNTTGKGKSSGKPLSLSVGPGVYLGASMMLGDVVPSDGSSKRTKVTVQGSYEFSLGDLKLRGAVANVALFGGASIQSASISLDFGNGSQTTSVSGVLLVQKASQVGSMSKPPASFSFAGSFLKNSTDQHAAFALSMANWQFGKSFAIKELNGSLAMTRNASSSPWSIEGEVSGNMDFFGIPLDTSFTIPFVEHMPVVSVDIPALKLFEGVWVDQVRTTINVSALEAGQPISIVGILNVSNQFGGARLLIDISANISSSSLQLSGRVTKWQMTKDLLVTDLFVNFDLSRATNTSGWTGSSQLVGAVDVHGAVLALSASLPFATGGLNISASNLTLSKGVIFSGALQVQPEAPQLQLMGEVTANTGSSKKAALTVAVLGIIDGSDSFTIAGSLDSWVISPKFEVKTLRASLVCARPVGNSSNASNASSSSSGAMACVGDIFGNLLLGTSQTSLEMHLTIPLRDGGISLELPDMRLSSTAYLYNTSVEYFAGEAQLNSTLRLGLPGANPLFLQARAVVKDGCLNFTATVDKWTVIQTDTRTMELDSLELSMTACDVSSSPPPSTGPAHKYLFGGFLTGNTSMMGGWADALLNFPGNLDEGSDGFQYPTMQMTWSSPTPSSNVTGLTGHLCATGSSMPPANHSQTLGGLTILQLAFNVTFGKTFSFNFQGAVQDPKFGLLALGIYVAQMDNDTKWGFAAHVQVSTPLNVSDAAPGSGVDSQVGGLESAYLVVANHPFTLTLLPGGPFGGQIVSLKGPGVSLGAMVALANVGGGSLGPVASSFGQTTVLATATWEKDADIQLILQLNDLPIGSKVLLQRAQMTISSTVPNLALSGSANVVLHPDLDPMELDASINISADSFSLVASLESYIFKVGHKGIDVADLTMKMNVSTSGATSVTGLIEGRALLAKLPSGAASASSEWEGPAQRASETACLNGNQFPGACAFDGDSDTVWDGCCDNYPAQTLSYTYDTPQKVLSYTFTFAGGNCPSEWSLQGSYEGGTWYPIHVYAAANETHCTDFNNVTYQVQSPGYYAYYKWDFKDGILGNASVANGYVLREVTLQLEEQVQGFNLMQPSGVGSCEEAKLRAVGSIADCTAAASQLGLTSDAQMNVSGQQFPGGCSLTTKSKTVVFNGATSADSYAFATNGTLICMTAPVASASMLLDLSKDEFLFEFQVDSSADYVTPNYIQASSSPSSSQSPSSMRSNMHGQLLEATLIVDVSAEPFFYVNASLHWGTFPGAIDIMLNISKYDFYGKWTWGFAMGIALMPFQLPQMSSSAKGLPSYLNFGEGVLLLSTYKVPVSWLGVKVTDGLVIQANLPFTNSTELGGISNMTGIEAALVEISYGFSSETFKILVALETEWWLKEPVSYVSDVDFFLEAGPKVPGFFELGLGVTIAQHVNGQLLEYEGFITVGDVGFGFGAILLTPWSDAFGVSGLEFTNAELVIDISWEVVPYVIGFAMGVKFGDISGSGAIDIDLMMPTQSVLAANIGFFSLAALFDAVTDATTTSSSPLDKVSLTNASLSVVPGASPVTFDRVTYQPGFRFSIQKFQFFALQGTAILDISKATGFYLAATIEPFSIMGGKLAIHGAPMTATKSPLQLLIAVGGGKGDTFMFSGACKFLGTGVSLYVDINKTGMDFQMDMSLFGIIDANISLFVEHENTGTSVDFDISIGFGSIENMIRKIEYWIADMLEDLIVDLSKVQADVQLWYDDKHPKLQDNEREIHRIKVEEERKIDQAIDKVHAAQRKVNRLRHRADDFRNEAEYDRRMPGCGCHFWGRRRRRDRACCHHWEWRIRADVNEARYKIDNAVADVADRVLEDLARAIKDLEKVLIELNPAILIREAEDGIINVAYKVLEGALGGASHVVESVQAKVGGGAPMSAIAYQGLLKQTDPLITGDCTAALALDSTGEMTIFSPASQIGNASAAVWTTGAATNCPSGSKFDGNVIFSRNGVLEPTGGCLWSEPHPNYGTADVGSYKAQLNSDCTFEIKNKDGTVYKSSVTMGSCVPATKTEGVNPLCPPPAAKSSKKPLLALDTLGCKGDFGAASGGDYIDCWISGAAMGKPFDLSFKVPFPPSLSSFIDAVANDLKDLF